MEFVIQKGNLSSSEANARLKKLGDGISDIRISPRSRFAKAFNALQPYQDTFWGNLQFKENMLRLLQILAKDGLNGTPELKPVMLNPVLVARLDELAPKGAEIKIVVESWKNSVPFHELLGATAMFCTSLVVPPSRFSPVKIIFDKTVANANGKSDMQVYVVGLKLSDYARFFRPPLEEIAGTLGGTVDMGTPRNDGSDFTAMIKFTFPAAVI